jgi:hypothetical protein
MEWKRVELEKLINWIQLGGVAQHSTAQHNILIQ